ncbi:hypothetical protein N0603_19805 [Pseudomonas aeruginosa]|nr:hypothetical protein [Pseudomonas aeruginosa]MCT0516128.1 hypothetical protein [Pseudomonas aeruginosa]MCT0564283.1 hypothetical protein [Pseudomonas aeruginosa]MCT1037440.1 hypothetical protein [Pseudomonas aeruginosa]MCT1074232.1 hypothetical protein [Pseudomonas aeruginosa]
MGWLFSHQTKEDLLRELLAPTSTFAGSTEVLAHAVSGNELWTVVKRTFHLAGFYFGKPAGHSITMIELHLLDCLAGQWGYKTIPESAGPFYYGCPLEFLDLAHDEINQEWRERMTHEHQA